MFRVQSFPIVLIVLAVLGFASHAQIPSPGPVQASLIDLVFKSGAANITTEFYKSCGRDRWELIATQLTSPRRTINTLIHPSNFTYTNYKFVFYTEEYYRARGLETFYPVIEIVFAKKDEKTHLILASMSPYGYSAYRGVVPS